LKRGRSGRAACNGRPLNSRGSGQDLSFVTVEVADSKGRWQPNAEPEIEFAVEGAAAIAGTASGDMSGLESYQSASRKAFQGRAQVVLRSTRQAGDVTLRIRAKDLPEATLVLKTRALPEKLLLP